MMSRVPRLCLVILGVAGPALGWLGPALGGAVGSALGVSEPALRVPGPALGLLGPAAVFCTDGGADACPHPAGAAGVSRHAS